MSSASWPQCAVPQGNLTQPLHIREDPEYLHRVAYSDALYDSMGFDQLFLTQSHAIQLDTFLTGVHVAHQQVGLQ